MAVIDREERRRDLLSHALAIFSEKGYHAAKVEDIVSRAGVARGTFYLYFEDKRGIFELLLDHFITRLREAILRLDPREPVRVQLRANVVRVLDLFESERELSRILLTHAVGIDPEFDQKLLDFYDAIVAMIVRALSLGQEMGIVRPCDVKLAAFSLLGSMKEVAYRIVMAGGRLDRGYLADELLDLSLYGLLAPDLARERDKQL